MKKILSFILAALMTASCAAYVAADDAAVEETTSNAAQDYAIEFLANYGIFKGYNAEDTGAEDDIQRYQMALFVSRISTGWTDDDKWEDGTANNATFKDIEEGAAANYLGAISYANQNGIIEGYTANTFAPYDNITYRDALTMVVRTLGYKGLTYPWGYIEKAVDLELTEGIGSDVAYTDNLTRGEVATIIYNAMFATTSKGTTLAKSIFDIDFKWQNIVVVSTDEYTTVYDADGKGVYAKEGYVGFKTIDSKTAKLGDKVYYVKSSEMGLTGHEEEQAVGSVFVALFEAVDGNFVTLVDADSAKMATIFNNGVTDNDGKAYETMPIAAALADYELVKDYPSGVVSYSYNDLKVFGYKNHEVYDVDGNATNVGIDISTGNILKWVECDTKTHGEKDHVCGWVVEWFYNSTLEKYYQYEVKKTTSGAASNAVADGDVYINWMSDEEFTKWYDSVVKKLIDSYSELTLLEGDIAGTMTKGNNPYSKLDLFDIDNDGLAEVANYKDYAIGMFANSSKVCGKNAHSVNHADGKEYPTYKITSLDDALVYEQFVEEGHVAHEGEKAWNAQFAWINVDPSVTTFVNEDGTYNDGVVVYRVNETTGEIEIVKHITDKAVDDADSYIVTGILQSYNTKTQKVVISGVEYPIAYPNLTGDMYKMANTNVASRAAVAATLDDQYMQYVTAVVCDGYVVDTDLLNATDDFIVVLGYAGITSDGYIAVYGYSTADLTMKVFKINSYNGWKQGDYRYYPNNAAEDDAFAYGALYTIKSYDAETESYGVYTENVETVLDGATPVIVTFERGYRSVQAADIERKKVTDDSKLGCHYEYKFTVATDKDGKEVAPVITKMTDNDKYVVVTNMGEDAVTSNIFVYDGIVNNSSYSINALMVVGNLDSSKLVLYTENTNVNGFQSNAYEVGYVLYEKANGTVLNAAYDEAIVGDYYLLGSTMSEVRVLNLLTGNRNYTLVSSNIDLKNGHIYKTIGGQIIADVTDECDGDLHNFADVIARAYRTVELDYATYVAGYATLTKDQIKSDVALASALMLDGETDYSATSTLKVIADKLIHNDRLVYFVDVDDDGYNWCSDHPLTEVSVLELADKTSYDCFIVYDVATTKTVIYVFGEGSIHADTTKTITNAGKPISWGDKTMENGDSIALNEVYTITATYADANCPDKITSATLDSLVLYYTAKDKDDNAKALKCEDVLHNLMANSGDALGRDYNKNLNEVVSVNGTEYAVNAKYESLDCGLTWKVTYTFVEPVSIELGENKIHVQVFDTLNAQHVFYANSTITVEYYDNNTPNDTYSGVVGAAVVTGDYASRADGAIDLDATKYPTISDGWDTIIEG